MRIIISRRPPPQMSMFESYGSYAGGRMSTAPPAEKPNMIHTPPADPSPSLIPEPEPKERNIPSGDSEGGDVEEQHAENQ